MCGADPQTVEGGDPNNAAEVIRNSKNISRHYWGPDTIKPAVSSSRSDGN